MKWIKTSFYSMESGNYKVSKSYVKGEYRYLLYKREGTGRFKLTEHDYFTSMKDVEKAINA